MSVTFKSDRILWVGTSTRLAIGVRGAKVSQMPRRPCKWRCCASLMKLLLLQHPLFTSLQKLSVFVTAKPCRSSPLFLLQGRCIARLFNFDNNIWVKFTQASVRVQFRPELIITRVKCVIWFHEKYGMFSYDFWVLTPPQWGMRSCWLSCTINTSDTDQPGL